MPAKSASFPKTTHRCHSVRDSHVPASFFQDVVSAFWHRYWQAALPVARDFPGSQQMAGSTAQGVILDAGPGRGGVALYRKALANEPDGFGTRPPWPIEVAGFLATRGIRFEGVPDLVFAGFAATERRASRAAYTDLRGTPQDLEQDRNMLYLFGYMPLAEAYARLGRLDSAKDILLQIEEKLAKMRPKDCGSREFVRVQNQPLRRSLRRGQFLLLER